MAMINIIIAIIVLVISFYLLAIISDDFFVASLDKISNKLKLSHDVAGATFMAIGSSAPELFTSFIAVFKPGNHANIGAGTIVGSALFNILVIIGVSALFKKARLNWQPIIRDMLFYSISIIILLITFYDGHISLTESLLFISIYIGYLFAVVNWKKIFPYKSNNIIDVFEENIKENPINKFSKKILSYIIPDCNKHPKLYILTFLTSIFLIGFLSYTLVESAIIIGDALLINPTIIALTVLAAGTSIPDLLSSVVVAKQGRSDMAISNAIGSNIFDILIGLGLPWLIIIIFQHHTVTVSNENLISSILLLFATVLSILILLISRKWTIGRYAGLTLIGLYIAYLGWNILNVI